MPLQMEFDGKDVESAVEKACKKLNIPAGKLKYDVISYGSTGIFGLVGARKARIRVNAPGGALRNTKRAKTAPVPDAVQPPTEPEPVGSAAPTAAEATSSPQPVQTTSSSELTETAPLPEPVESPSPTGLESTDAPGETAGERAEAATVDEAALQAGQDALQRMVDAISDGATIAAETSAERILFNISAADSALLIGKRGQTLEALQYMVEKIVNLRSKDRILVQVDVEGYLKNRKDNLIQIAESLAEKVKRTGKPASAGQLNSHDRRIIHLALKEDDGVRTQSIGAGLYRKLMIFPKKSTEKKKPN